MAPRGGGGHSTGGGGGYLSSGSNYYSDSSDVWFQYTQLYGSKFHDAKRVAGIVFAAIFLIALLGISFWAASVKRKHKYNRRGQPTKQALGSKRWSAAIAFGLIYFAFLFSASIIYENNTDVANVFFIIQTLIYASGYVAEILLLLTIYTILLQCFAHPNRPEDPKSKHKSTILVLHIILCAILAAVYISYFALRIRDTVGRVENGRIYAPSYALVTSKVLVTYRVLYFVASLEVTLATVYLTVNAQKFDLRRTVGIGLLGLIGFPFLVYTVTCLAFSVRFVLDHYYYSTATSLAEEIIEGITFVLVYAGVVLACKQLAQAAWTPWQGDQQYGQGPVMQQGGPMVSTSPQYVQQYGAPSQPFAAASQHYGPPPEMYGSPPRQYGPTLQQYGVPPQQLGPDNKPYNMGAAQAHEVPATHNN